MLMSKHAIIKTLSRFGFAPILAMAFVLMSVSVFAADPACPLVLQPSLEQMLQSTKENPDAVALGREAQTLTSRIQKVETRVADMLKLLKKRNSLMKIDQLAEDISYCRSDVERCSTGLRVRMKAVIEHLDEIEAMRVKLQELMSEIDGEPQSRVQQNRVEVQNVLLELDKYQISLRQSLNLAQAQTQDGRNLKYQIMKLLNSGAPSKTLDVMNEEKMEKWILANPAMQTDGVSPRLKVLASADSLDSVLYKTRTFVTDNYEKKTDTDIDYILKRVLAMDFEGLVETKSSLSVLQLLDAIADAQIKRTMSDEEWLAIIGEVDRIYDFFAPRQLGEPFLWIREQRRKDIHLNLAARLSNLKLKEQFIQSAKDRLERVEALMRERGYSDVSWKIEKEPHGIFGENKVVDRSRHAYERGIAYYSNEWRASFGESNMYPNRWVARPNMGDYFFVTPFKKTKNLQIGDHFQVHNAPTDIEWNVKKEARLIGFFPNGDVLLTQTRFGNGIDRESILRVSSSQIVRTRSDIDPRIPQESYGKFDQTLEKYKGKSLFQYNPEASEARRLMAVWGHINWIDKMQGHVISNQFPFIARDELVVADIFDPKLKALGVHAGGIITLPGSSADEREYYFVFGTFLNGDLCVGGLSGKEWRGFQVERRIFHETFLRYGTSIPEVLPLERAQNALRESPSRKVRREW